jgi:chitodextrinase
MTLKKLKFKNLPLFAFIVGVLILSILIGNNFNITRAATESISIIREDCAGYSNCYTSLASWESAEQRDLVASDEIAVARIEGTWTNPDTTSLTIDGWTTGPDNYIRIYTAGDARHNSKWDASAYRLSSSNPSAYILLIKEEYVRIDGLQIYQQSGEASGCILLSTSGGEIQVSNNIIRGTPGTTVGRYMLSLDRSGPNGTVKVWNNIFYDGRNGIYHNYGDAGNTYIIYNNTLVDVENKGIYVTDSVGDVALYLKNNIVQGTDTNYNFTSFTNFTHSNNLSEDATSPDTSYQSKAVTFADEANDDFHLASGDTEAKDNGTDLSADAQLSFSDDIDGETRGGTWDIGADESGGASTPPTYQCSDGLDNDSDGLTDYPNDPGCSSSTDDNETDPVSGDTVSPTRSAGSPTGTLSSGTTSATLSLNTDESAVCKYSSTSGVSYASMANTFSATGSTSHSTTISGLQDGQSYTYYIKCEDLSGNANTDDYPISFSIDTTTPQPDNEPPTIPANLTATAVSSTQINLTWDESTDNVDVTGYSVYRDGIEIAQTQTTSYSNTGLASETTYTYAVTAHDLEGNESGQSTEVQATTQQDTGFSVTAASCYHDDIQAAVDQVEAAGGGTVYIPAGDCTWTGSSPVTVKGNVSIIGAGIDKTIIRSPERHTSGFFKHTDILTEKPLVVYSGFSIYAENSLSSQGIYLRDVKNFRITNCHLEGSWHGMITMMRVAKGLIDHCRFIRPPGSATYGIHFTSNYAKGTKPALCDVENDIDCQNTWNDWYTNPEYQNPPFDDDWIPGTENAIFVEDNDFTGYNGATMQGNWGSVASFVFRYNTVFNSSGLGNGGIKPGGIWAEIYNNTFTLDGGDGSTSSAITFRTSGLIHHNTFENYYRGGQMAAYWCSNDFCYTDEVLMDELYIWDNTYINSGCPEDSGTCWKEWSEGAPERITEGENYFFHKPGTGPEAIRDALANYTPYTYPHPLVSGETLPSDTTPPATSGHSPAKGASDVPVDSNITLHIQDSGDGVDQSTIVMTVEGQEVTPAISGTAADYTITYDPQTDFDHGQTINITVSASDLAGNIMTQETYSFTTLTKSTPADTIPPSNPTIVINSNQIKTNTTQVTLILSATDNTAVSMMRFSNDNITWTAVEDYLTVKDWILSSDDGVKTVYVQFADAADNWSSVASDTIILDTTPPTISNPTVSDITVSSVIISFSSVEEATATINYGPTISYGLTEAISSAPATVHTVNLTNLSDNTTYHYQLIVADSLGNQTTTLDYTFTTQQATVLDTTPPAAITDLDINNIGTNSLTLSWSAPGDDSSEGIASSYDLRYSTAEITSSNFDQAAELTGLPSPQVAGTLQSYDVIDLSPNTFYYFALKTVDEAGNLSNLSNIVYAITNTPPLVADTTPPAAITDLAVSNITQSSVLLSWTAPGDDNGSGTAHSYDVRYLKGEIITGQNWISATQITVGEPTPTTAGASQTMSINATNANLEPNTAYYIAIKTFDEAPNVSDLSNIVSFTTLAEPAAPDTTPPAAITDLTAAGSTKDSITLSWTAPGDDNNIGTANSYDLRYLVDSITESNWNQAVQVTNEPIPEISGTAQRITIGGLNPYTTYYFALKALDEAQNASNLSNIVSQKTLTGTIAPTSTSRGGGYHDTTPPKQVDLPTAQGAKGQILLTWQNPTDNDFIRTIIIRKENSAPTSRADGQTVYQGTDRQYTDINLKDDTTYYYAFYTLDRSGNYSAAKTVNTTTTQKTNFQTTDRSAQLTLPDRTLVKAGNSPQVYIISGQRKRWIPTAEVFQKSSYRWSDIQTVSQEELAKYSDNMLVKTKDNPKIYLITPNGQKRWLPNEQSFYSYDFTWDQIETISQTELDAYPINNQVKTEKSDDIYYIYQERYKKRYPTKESFYSYGHQDEDIVEISQTELDSYKQIKYVKNQDDPTVYWLNQRKKTVYPIIHSIEELNQEGIEVLEVSSTEMKAYTINIATQPLPQRLAGRILLQVESQGEAWYVNPLNYQRYYLGRPQDAFKIMKEQALGVKHSFIANTTTFPDRLKGRILIDVEQNGEAYYINPTNQQKYYLSRPADAFRIMKELALGISNADLEEVEVGSVN